MMPDVTLLPGSAFAVLDALRVYKFLTLDQFHRLGVSSSLTYVTDVVRDLANRKKKLVNKVPCGSIPTIGKLSDLHHLTQRGAELLADALQIERKDVPYPHGAVIIRDGYFHLLHSIDCEIAARQWVKTNDGAEVMFYHQYFNYTGANRTKKKDQDKRQSITSMRLENGDALVPDSAFRLSLAGDRQPLFMLEMYNQRRTDRVIKQAIKYTRAISEHVINKRYDYAKAPRILFLFEDDKAMDLVKKRMAATDPLPRFAKFFFFHTLGGLRHDFRTNWQQLDSTAPVDLF